MGTGFGAGLWGVPGGATRRPQNPRPRPKSMFFISVIVFVLTHLLEERQNIEFLILEIERLEFDNKKKGA